MKKILLVSAAVVALVLILFLIAVSRLDSAALGARAIEQIHRKTGIELHAERIALHPVKGLDLDLATAIGTAPSGTFTASIEHLRIKHRLLPLLWGEVVMSEVLLQRPVVELVSKPAVRSRRDRSKDQKKRGKGEKKQGVTEQERVAEEAEVADGEGLRLSIKSLRIENGALLARTVTSEEPDLSLEQLNLKLEGLKFDAEAETSTTAVSGRGRFSTGRIVHGDFAATQSNGRVQLAEGRAAVTDLEVQSENADLIIQELEVRLDRDPPSYTFAAAGGLDLNGVLQVERGGRFGSVGIDLDASGRGPELNAMTGEGTLNLNAGSLPGFPAMVQIEDLLGRPLLTGREYETATVDYKLVDNQLIIAPFELIAEGGNVGGSGAVDLGGTLDLDVFVRVPRETLDIGVVDKAHLTSLEDEEGMVKIPFTLTGTFEDPRVGMEWEGMKELIKGAGRSWAERALEDAADKAREWLQEQSGTEDDGK